jgi:hypothetical protein
MQLHLQLDNQVRDMPVVVAELAEIVYEEYTAAQDLLEMLQEVTVVVLVDHNHLLMAVKAVKVVMQLVDLVAARQLTDVVTEQVEPAAAIVAVVAQVVVVSMAVVADLTIVDQIKVTLMEILVEPNEQIMAKLL